MGREREREINGGRREMERGGEGEIDSERQRLVS